MKIFSLLLLFFVVNLNIGHTFSQNSSSSIPIGLVLHRSVIDVDQTIRQSMSFNLILYGSDKYKMFVSFAFSIISDSILISSGKFRQDDKFLYLTDERTGCNQVFKREKFKYLWYSPYVVFSGFLDSRGFCEYNFSVYEKQNGEYWKKWNCKTLNVKQNSKYSTLRYGKYDGKYSSIELTPPDKYVYRLRDYAFSKGTFKRIGRTNKLQLMDEKLMQPVYFFIRDAMLIDNFIVLDPSCSPTELRYSK